MRTDEQPQNTQSFSSWEPEVTLPDVSLDYVRLSRGFLRSNPAFWCEGISEYWEPFFRSLEQNVSIVESTPSLDFPRGLRRMIPVEVDGESVIIGTDDVSIQSLVDVLVPDAPAAIHHILMEYLERRILVSLGKSWFERDVRWNYVSSKSRADVEIVGSVRCVVSVGGKLASVWFGLGAQLVDGLDARWRSRIRTTARREPSADDASELHTVSVQLAELAVAPAALIDYLRVGSIINLGVPVSRRVLLKVNRNPWAQGVLAQSGGRFAVEMVSFAPADSPVTEASTRVQVELCSLALDAETLEEHRQQGAVLLTNSRVMAEASLVISGENVASVIIGEVDGNFALNVLPRWSR